MTKAFFITEDEAPILRQIINDYRRRNRSMELQESGGVFEDEPDEIFTPECYVIEIPANGIPGMEYSDDSYIPGKADCTVYKTWPLDEDDEELIETDFDHEIHNLSLGQIDGSVIEGTGTGTGTGSSITTKKFRIGWRDKFGTWFTQHIPYKRYGITQSAIAAATLDEDLRITPGSAYVREYVFDSDHKLRYLKETLVYNPWPDEIAQTRLITFSCAEDGLLTVDAEACNSFTESSTGTGTGS